MAHLHDGAAISNTTKVFDNVSITDDADIVPNISDDQDKIRAPRPPTFTLATTYTTSTQISNAVITYSPPDNNGGSAITAMSYRFKLSSSDTWGAWDPVTSLTAGSTVTVAGLTAGEQYDFQMRAQNAVGWSFPSVTMQIIITGLPLVPTFSVTGRNASILLMITPPTSGGVPTGYRYRLRRRNSADTRWSNAQTAVDIGNVLSHNITVFNNNNNIENERRHQVSVRSYNDVGTSAWTGWTEVLPTALSFMFSLGGMFYSLGNKMVALGM